MGATTIMTLIHRVLYGTLMFIMCACAAFAQTAPAKIILINTDAFYDAKAGITKLVSANKQLDTEFAAQIKALQEGGARLQAIAKELENMQKLPTSQFNQTAYTTKQEEGERLQRQLNYNKTDLENAIKKRREVLVSPISADIGNAIGEFAKKNGFGVIFDVSKLADSGILLFLADSAEVTKEFIVFYNTRPTPVAPPK